VTLLPRTCWNYLYIAIIVTLSNSLSRPNNFQNPILFSDGIGSSGKRMLGHILASFESVEKMSHHFVFDYVADLHWLGKITDDAAMAYLQTEADLQTYQLMLSRDQNFRPGDTTGILSNPRPGRYFARLFFKEGDAAVARIQRHNPWLHEAPHDGLRKASLYFSAFGNRLRIVHIMREPHDLVADLVRRGFDWRVGVDPREFQLTLLKKNQVIPIVLRDLEIDLAEISGPDLAALTVSESMRHNLLGYSALNSEDREKVKIVFFDAFCTHPERVVSELSSFLGALPTRSTRRAVRRENLPRRLPDRSLSRSGLFEEMSEIGRRAMSESMNMYSEMLGTRG